MASTSESFEDIVRGLSSSPLFNLSLASKELFHSNFLAWLCEAYPEPAGEFFAKYLKTPPASSHIKQAARERRNVDLTLKYPDGQQLIIENKVKSIPSKEQLKEISSKKWDPSKTSFLLLTLVDPLFRLEGAGEWLHLTYRQLACALEQLLPRIDAAGTDRDYHGKLVRDYIAFIRRLDELQSLLAVRWEDESSDFFAATPQQFKDLKRIRVHDVIDKLRYAKLSEELIDALRGDGFSPKDAISPRDLEIAPTGTVVVESEMTHGTGLTNLKYVLTDKARFGESVVLGVQLQGNQFRLFIRMTDKEKAEKAAQALWAQREEERLWFDFLPIKRSPTIACPSGEYPHPRRGCEKTFNVFSGRFFWRAVHLQRASPRELVRAIAAYAGLIRENQEQLCQRLDAALKRTRSMPN